MQMLRPLTAWIERTTRRRALGPRWPQALGRSQVFILPTGFGLLAAATILLLLMVALNYQNSPVFLLAFLFGALLWTAMVACHRHLRNLEVRSVTATPVFAGEPPCLCISLHSPGRARRGLVCFAGERESGAISLASGGSGHIDLSLPGHPRGRHLVHGLGLASREPLGVFRAWCRMAPVECIVYPRPASHAVAPPGRAEGTGGDAVHAQPEDFAGLAPYRPGDRPGQIAWRAYARSGTLERKQFASGGSAARWLDFDAAPAGDDETRLSILARWVLDAERSSSPWGLRLPGHAISPGRGSSHLTRCLRALAMFPGPYDDRAS